MCTALVKKTGNGTFFLRNLDDTNYFKNEFILTPKNKEIPSRGYMDRNIIINYEIWGIGKYVDNYPLYFDCVNEHGLSFAALSFMSYAKYLEFNEDKLNLTPFELPLYILGMCKDVKEALKEIQSINLLDKSFSNKIGLTPLHFIFADTSGDSLIVEPLETGLKFYPGKEGVLTNSPTYDYQLLNLSNYKYLSKGDMKNEIGFDLPSFKYSHGLGAYGLPGDYSSCSRFVKANYLSLTFLNSSSKNTNLYNLFNILEQVSMPMGAVYINESKRNEVTIYSVIYSLNKRLVYVRKYGELDIRTIDIDLHRDEGEIYNVIRFPI